MKTTTSQPDSSIIISSHSADLPVPDDFQADSSDAPLSLSTAQEQALEWLIGGGSVAEAAQFAGVTRQTISRWLRENTDFRAVYDAWKYEANQLLEGRLVAASDAAMENLLHAVRAKADLQASKFVIKALLGIKDRCQKPMPSTSMPSHES